MISKVNFLKIRSNLNQTMVTDLYAKYFDYGADTFTNPLIRDINHLYNKIVSELSILTKDQETVLLHVFEKFSDIQELIDPNRLKDFSYSMTDDNDLVLSRNSEAEAINLIIYPEDDFALSIIHREEGSSLSYFDNLTADYEQIVYSFLK